MDGVQAAPKYSKLGYVFEKLVPFFEAQVPRGIAEPLNPGSLEL